MPNVRSKIVGIIRVDDGRYACAPPDSWIGGDLASTLSRLLTGGRVPDICRRDIHDRFRRRFETPGKDEEDSAWLPVSRLESVQADIGQLYGELCELLAHHVRENGEPPGSADGLSERT